ncbi:MAG: PKD domain-containing protein [Lewinellaceae bacterium]|nr:PKD domain-containing protein [Lewinellaceae bacterium]
MKTLFYWILFVGFLSSCNLEEIPDQLNSASPKALIQVSPGGCESVCTVTITNNSTNATSWAWSFGDGQTSTVRDPANHTYNNPGNYTIRLIACNAQNICDTATATVVVAAPNVPPTASFNVVNDGCSATCTIDFVNTSQNATRFEWDFGDGTALDTMTSPSHQFQTAGTFTVQLKAYNGVLNQTTSKTVTIKPGGFKTSLNISTQNVTPLRIAERNDGTLHLLYYLSGYKSVLIDPNTQVTDNPVSFSLDMSVNQSAVYNGGFLLSGEKSGKIKVAQIDAVQSKKLETSGFDFNGNSANGQGVIINAAGELVLTGLRASPSLYPGFAKLNATSGAIISNPVINNVGLENYGGISIVQKTTNDYFLTANFLAPPGGQIAQLLSVSTTGVYNAKYALSPLKFANLIIKTLGNNYAVLGKDGNGVYYVLGINSNGTVAWQREMLATTINDMIYTADGQLAVCGTQSGAMYWAKFPASSGSQFSWQKTVPGANGTISGLSLVQTADGGYLLLGQYDNAGKQEPYLIKTNSSGEAP